MQFKNKDLKLNIYFYAAKLNSIILKFIYIDDVSYKYVQYHLMISFKIFFYLLAYYLTEFIQQAFILADVYEFPQKSFHKIYSQPLISLRNIKVKLFFCKERLKMQIKASLILLQMQINLYLFQYRYLNVSAMAYSRMHPKIHPQNVTNYDHCIKLFYDVDVALILLYYNKRRSKPKTLFKILGINSVFLQI